MAKGKKTGGRNFVAGMSGNPHGRPPQTEATRDLRSANRARFEETLTSLIFLTIREVQERIENESVTALEAMIGRVILSAAGNGDHRRLEFLLNRLIGKPPNDPADHASRRIEPTRPEEYPPGLINSVLVDLIEDYERGSPD